MHVHRHFRLAPALARLLRKERGIDEHFAEGHFPAHPDRDHFVSIAPGKSHLVIRSLQPGSASAEERTEVPRAHAEALLDVCVAKAVYGRTHLKLPGAREAWADHLLRPGQTDLVTLTFGSPAEAESFPAQPWLGPEVSDDPAYQMRSIALNGVPPAEELPLSNAALNALLDLLDGRAPPGAEAPIASQAAGPVGADEPALAEPPAPLADATLEVRALDGDQAADRDDPIDASKFAPVESTEPPALTEPEGAERPLEQMLSDLSQFLAKPPAQTGASPESEPERPRPRSGWEFRRPSRTPG